MTYCTCSTINDIYILPKWFWHLVVVIYVLNKCLSMSIINVAVKGRWRKLTSYVRGSSWYWCHSGSFILTSVYTTDSYVFDIIYIGFLHVFYVIWNTEASTGFFLFFCTLSLWHTTLFSSRLRWKFSSRPRWKFSLCCHFFHITLSLFKLTICSDSSPIKSLHSQFSSMA